MTIALDLVEPAGVSFLPLFWLKGEVGLKQPRLARCGTESTSWFMVMKEGQRVIVLQEIEPLAQKHIVDRAFPYESSQFRVLRPPLKSKRRVHA